MNLLISQLKVWAGTALTLVLIGCGSTSEQRSLPTQRGSETANQAETLSQLSPREYLQQAQQGYLNDGNRQRRNQLILQAALAYKQAGECQHSQKVLSLALPEVEQTELRQQAWLLLAECALLATPVDYPRVQAYVEQLASMQGQEERLAEVRFALFLQQKNWLAAANALLPVAVDNLDNTYMIWYLLQNLTAKQTQAALLSEPQLSAWLQLSLLVKQHGLAPAQLTPVVEQWQRRFNQHLLSQRLPSEVAEAMSVPASVQRRVAVLLPLSGRLTAQGQAIKQGILAAYLATAARTTDPAEQQPELDFFDTQTTDMATLAQQVADYDWVIGPLLKDNLTEFAQLLPAAVNLLGLNRLDESLTDPGIIPAEQPVEESSTPLVPAPSPGARVYFALSPEDEAVQLAQKVYDTGVAYPIVVTQDAGSPRRMANTFMQTWQLLVGDSARAPGLATYVDNNSMRTSLTTLLDVAQSKTRIDQIEGLTSNQIHSVPRNRRDVDAIVLFATPEQTELLNPIVETSLSPFNDQAVPVYASSRSYSQNFSNNSLRDLRNITFTDMPWMLPGHSQQALQQEFSQIWPNRDDTLKRLFALGYDAFDLLPELLSLTVLPQVSRAGLTGSLSVDNQGNIVRVLPFGKITENEVILLAGD